MLKGLRKVFLTDDIETHALADISLEINRGEYVCIAGPSGCGKSTLLAILGLLEPATEGEYILNGKEVANLPFAEQARIRNREIGFIFQSFNLVPVLSAYENVEYPLLLVGRPGAERRERTREILDAVGLGRQARQRPNELSGGQKQRVAIARALVKRPQIVLADEPTANLDTRTGASIIELMHRVQRDFRTTFIFSTHDPQLISHSEEIFTIRDGELVEHKSYPASDAHA